MRHPHHSPEEWIKYLERELQDVRHDLLSMAPQDFRGELLSFYRCESREDSLSWDHTLVSTIIDRATLLDLHPALGTRAICPLCGDESSSPYSRGFSVPEGLKRHLTGWGTTGKCRIMKAACALAREWWHKQFHEEEQRQRVATEVRLVQRRKAELQYRHAPDLPPLLLDEHLGYEGVARSAEEMAWAKARLVELQFEELTDKNVVQWTQQGEGFVVYADPRKVGEITFRVFKVPKPRGNRGRLRFDWTKAFNVRDSWKVDIQKKYSKRLLETVATLK